jgi:site-specific DNA-cytosine methylase
MIANTLQVTCGDYSRPDGFNAVVEPASVTSFAQNQRGELRESSIAAQLTTGGGKPGEGYPAVRIEQPIVAPTLTAANNPSRSPQSTEVTQQIEAVHKATVSFQLGNTKANGSNVNTEGVAYTLDQAAGQGVLTDTLGSEIAKPLGSLTGGPRTTDIENATYVGGPSVRRLTPTECERLMGWPDGWTAIDGDKTPDGRRYAACGNGVVANVSEWIGRRIMAIDGEL